MDVMFERQIPLKYWSKVRHDIVKDLSKERLDEISYEVNQFYIHFLLGKLIRRIDSYGSKDYMQKDIINFISYGCDTPDAFLLSQAHYDGKCEIFISNDGTLFKLMKGKHDIEVINAQMSCAKLELTSKKILDFMA